MTQLTGIRFKGRTVRCNDADEGDKVAKSVPNRPKDHYKELTKNSPRQNDNKKAPFHRGKDDWRTLMGKAPGELKGEIPDFSEEGWARRRPKKK
jgi:ATP-dependent RNA helicase DeaD